MILTDYYKAEKLPHIKAKTRYDIVASTESYDLFESLLINKRNPEKGGLSFYYGDRPESWGNNKSRKPGKAITKTTNISSVFVPDPSLPYAHGDINGTSDAIIIVFTNNYNCIEIFIARGQLNNVNNIYNLFIDGELEEEIEILIKKSKKLKS